MRKEENLSEKPNFSLWFSAPKYLYSIYHNYVYFVHLYMVRYTCYMEVEVKPCISKNYLCFQFSLPFCGDRDLCGGHTREEKFKCVCVKSRLRVWAGASPSPPGRPFTPCTRICLPVFTSHHTGRANIVRAIVAAHPDTFESWFYHRNLRIRQPDRSCLLDDISELPEADRVRLKTTAAVHLLARDA